MMEYWKRVKLANQCRILEHIDDDASYAWRKARIIFERGYTQDYDRALRGLIRENETSREVCKEVSDILQMFSVLEHSYNELDEVPGVDQQDVEFWGFDGNNEAEHLDYARFLVEVDGKFAQIKDKVVNSHCPTLQRYQPMLEEYQNQNTAGPPLGADAIQTIVQAGKPDS